MPKGISLLIVGTEGVGKTSFAAEFPKPIDFYSMSETGCEDLIDLGKISDQFVTDYVIDSFQELLTRIRNSQARTIVLDSVSGLQRVIFNYCASEDYGGDYDAFLDYYKGPRQQCPAYADQLCSLLENKRREGVHVILLAHTKVETIKNPKGLDYTTFEIDADEGIRSVFKKYMANILFMDLDPGTERVTKSLKGKAIEAKMKDHDIRVIFTQKSLTHTAKNKLDLPLVIPMGDSPEEAYDTFVDKLPPLFKDQLQ